MVANIQELESEKYEMLGSANLRASLFKLNHQLSIRLEKFSRLGQGVIGVKLFLYISI